MKRSHLTSRLFDSRLVRKTLGYSKLVEMHRAAAAWDDIVYDLVRPHKTLRLRVFDDPKAPLAATDTHHGRWSDQSYLDF